MEEAQETQQSYTLKEVITFLKDQGAEVSDKLSRNDMAGLPETLSAQLQRKNFPDAVSVVKVYLLVQGRKQWPNLDIQDPAILEQAAQAAANVIELYRQATAN